MTSDHMSMFDKLNLAQCAKLRACASLMDGERFRREYETARLWMKYRVVSISSDYRYIDQH